MKSLVLLLSIAFLSNVSFGADGSSGCGPGWYVAKKNSLLSSALRVTTNGIFSPVVTLGMTFGTSNCSKHSIVRNEVEDIKFATENYFEIASDSSKGEGKFLTAYAEIMGCKGESILRFNDKMKENFDSLFKSENVDPQNLVRETYITILKDKVLTNSCFAA